MSSKDSDRPLRHLAPAPATKGQQHLGDHGASREIARRRNLIKNACRVCQAKKTKCDGKRPKCLRCTSRGLTCRYDTLYEGMTKQESTCHENERLKKLVKDFEDMFNILRDGSSDEAQAMLSSIRSEAHLGGDAQGNCQLRHTSAGCFLSPGPTLMLNQVAHEHNFLPLLFNPQGCRKQDQSASYHPKTDPSLLQGACSLYPHLDGSTPLAQRSEPVLCQPASFGNLPFSSSIPANHYPRYIQKQQHDNLFEPRWAIHPLTTLPGESSVKESVAATIRQAKSMIANGQSLQDVCGKQCNIAAVFDRDQYNATSLLSKWAAGFIYSIQRKNQAFVTFASMHLVWTLAKWLIEPSPVTYEAIPEWFRPTTLQLLTPHVEMLDFVLWAGLRDMVAANPQTLQRDWRWLEDIGREIDCDWFLEPHLALETDTETGEIYLTSAAKESAEDLDNWSTGSSACRFIQVLDSVAKVRSNLQYSFS